MTLRSAAKRLVIGTAWEGAVKHVHSLITGSKNSRYDHLTIRIMRRALARDSVAVDIGAFEGGMLRHMLRFAPNGGHFAFEPLPDRYALLKRRFPGVSVFPYALSDSPGGRVFHEVIGRPAFSGLQRRSDLGREVAVREHTVPVETLDRLIPPEVTPSLIKIDVEGGELGVLRGGLETLRRSRPIVVFECGLGGADSYGSNPEDIYSTITAEAGLRVFLLDSWLAQGAPLAQAEFREQFDSGLNYYFVAGP